jgi:hypothetical protein
METPIASARALLDEDEGRFTIEVKLLDGSDVSFTSNVDESLVAMLKDAFAKSALIAEAKPKPRRRSKKAVAE